MHPIQSIPNSSFCSLFCSILSNVWTQFLDAEQHTPCWVTDDSSSEYNSSPCYYVYNFTNILIIFLLYSNQQFSKCGLWTLWDAEGQTIFIIRCYLPFHCGDICTETVKTMVTKLLAPSCKSSSKPIVPVFFTVTHSQPKKKKDNFPQECSDKAMKIINFIKL